MQKTVIQKKRKRKHTSDIFLPQWAPQLIPTMEVWFISNNIFNNKDYMYIDQQQPIGSPDSGDVEKNYVDAKAYILSTTTKDGLNL